MKKTIVSLLLIVTMLLTMIPPAMAEPEETPPAPGVSDGSAPGEPSGENEPGEDDGEGGDAESPGTGDDTDPADLYYLALTAENFPDERFRGLILEKFQHAVVQDEADVTYAPKSAVLALTTLDISVSKDTAPSAYAITTMKGIELLPNLQKLSCRYRSLTSLDLSGCPNLKSVDCSGNNISSLILTENNAALEVLACEHNQISELDLSHAVNLIGLSCGYNKLTSLDLSQSPLLNGVVANACQLEQIILPKTGCLVGLSVSANQLTALDISGQTGLIELNCDSNNLSELDIGDLAGLERLKCTKNRLTKLEICDKPDLDSVKCSDNQLVTLTLDALPLLRTLDCSNNRLTSLDLAGVPLVSHLYCGDNLIAHLDISENPELREVVADSNKLTDIRVGSLPRLSKLHVLYNELTTLDLSGAPGVCSLAIAGNRMPYLDLTDHPANVALTIYGFDTYTPHRVSGTGLVQNGKYSFDMKTLIPEDLLRWVDMKTDDAAYDNTSGIVTLPSALPSIQYRYICKPGGSGHPYSYDMYVEVSLTYSSAPALPSGQNFVFFEADDLPAGRTVEVEGISYRLSEDDSVLLPDGVSAGIITEYSFNKSGADPHEIYPTSLRVWQAVYENGRVVARRMPELDDVLQYSGSSIRITGNKGIRMITSVPKDKKKSLTSKNGLSGWTLLEYGTVVAWDSELGADSLTLNHAAAK